MSTVNIKTKMLMWALERSGLNAADLQNKYPKIQQWIAGESQPTLRQLEGFAKTTVTPLGFFFLDEPPEEHLPIPYYRTIDEDGINRPSPDLIDTIQLMQKRQAWISEFLIEEGQEPAAFVKSALIGERPEAVAEKALVALGLEDGWAAKERTWTDALKTLRDAMDNAGIIVVTNGIVGNNTHRQLDPNEFRGFVLVDDYAPLVFVNGADGKAAQMFTLAHELAHVFYGSSAAFDLREMQPSKDPVEKACNSMAAEFLVPAKLLRDAWPSARKEDEPFQALARRFKVSSLVVARRALDLSLIDKNAFLHFYGESVARERGVVKKSEGGDFYLTQNQRIGHRFAFSIVRAAKEGKLLYSEAYKLTGLYGKTFDKFASTLMLGGALQ